MPKPRTPADHAAVLIETATRALAAADGQPATEPVLRHYRDDARAVALAVAWQMQEINVAELPAVLAALVQTP